ncbi:MAG TPA: hypothetical protein VMU07_02610 [Candidatus Paceibacterota bacterium]|nr:hypothetical protein [Candidatus Paceibacterota bacterium]
MPDEYVKITLIISGEANQELADKIIKSVGEENVGIGGDADELAITCKKEFSEKVLKVIHEGQYDKVSNVEVHPVHTF